MTQSNDKQAIHWGFWVIGALTLVWNFAGAVNFFAQMDPEVLELYRESERALVEARPPWATVMFGLAVFAGTLGSIALLLRRAVSVPLFGASLVGVLGATIHAMSAGVAFEAGELMGIILMPIVVAAFLVWYSMFCVRQAWLR